MMTLVAAATAPVALYFILNDPVLPTYSQQKNATLVNYMNKKRNKCHLTSHAHEAHWQLKRFPFGHTILRLMVLGLEKFRGETRRSDAVIPVHPHDSSLSYRFNIGAHLQTNMDTYVRTNNNSLMSYCS